MRPLFDELRRNPDIVAVLVLSLALGIARQSVPRADVWIDPPQGMRIHRVLSRPAHTLDALGNRLALLSERIQRRTHRRLPELAF
jgi:hypothetical protein